MRVVNIGTFYKLSKYIDLSGCNSAVVPDTNESTFGLVNETVMWHQNMPHIGEKGLRDIQSKGIVEGLLGNSLEVNFYEHCVYRKYIHVRFP